MVLQYFYVFYSTKVRPELVFDFCQFCFQDGVWCKPSENQFSSHRKTKLTPTEQICGVQWHIKLYLLKMAVMKSWGSILSCGLDNPSSTTSVMLVILWMTVFFPEREFFFWLLKHYELVIYIYPLSFSLATISAHLRSDSHFAMMPAFTVNTLLGLFATMVTYLSCGHNLIKKRELRVKLWAQITHSTRKQGTCIVVQYTSIWYIVNSVKRGSYCEP